MERIPRRRHGLGAAVSAATAFAAVLALTVSAAIGLAATNKSAVAPSNTSPPTTTGTAQVGKDLTAANGTWSGTEPITFTYQWRRCDTSGANCSDISGATNQTYTLTSADQGKTVRVVVNAKNADGTGSAASVQTGAVTAAGTPGPTPGPGAGANGCPSGQGDQATPVANISPPARLQVDQFQSTSSLSFSTRSFQLRVHVGSTCNQAVQGAQVYATAVPFNQFSIPSMSPTGTDGWVTLTFNRMIGFPATPKQQLLALFIRASKPGEPILAGISTRRLVSLRVHH